MPVIESETARALVEYLSYTPTERKAYIDRTNFMIITLLEENVHIAEIKDTFDSLILGSDFSELLDKYKARVQDIYINGSLAADNGIRVRSLQIMKLIITACMIDGGQHLPDSVRGILISSNYPRVCGYLD